MLRLVREREAIGEDGRCVLGVCSRFAESVCGSVQRKTIAECVQLVALSLNVRYRQRTRATAKRSCSRVVNAIDLLLNFKLFRSAAAG